MAGTSGSISTPAPKSDTEFAVLCDDNGAFLRRYVDAGGAAPTVVDTLLDGSTTYAPVGTVRLCSAAPNPQVESTVQRQAGAGTVTVAAGARSVTVTVVAGAPTVAIGSGAAVTLPAGSSFTWGVDRGGDPGEALQDAFVFTGAAGADLLVHTTREL